MVLSSCTTYGICACKLQKHSSELVDDAKIFASLCEINKNYFGYDGCLGRQVCKFCVDFLIRLLISKPMPRAYTWFMVFVTDQNHLEGFQKKKKKGFKYYQLQAT